tara:strand:+ start:1428 stop:1673 length:246 start_codon:yes stop_codon:yes gene_type:complete
LFAISAIIYYNTHIRKENKMMTDDELFDLGVDLHDMVERELIIHGIKEDISWETDGAIDRIVISIRDFIPEVDEQELDSPQ